MYRIILWNMHCFVYDFTDHRPTFGELAIIPGLESQWFTVGKYLRVDPETLDRIRNTSTKLFRKQREMFKAYLMNNPHATWKTIIKALQHCKRDDLAKEVCEIFQLPTILLMQMSTNYGNVEESDPCDMQCKEVYWNDKQHGMMDRSHFAPDTAASEVLSRQLHSIDHNSPIKSCSVVQKLKQNSDDADFSPKSATYSPANKQPSLVQDDSANCKHLTPGGAKSERDTNVPSDIQIRPQSKDTFMPRPAIAAEHEDSDVGKLDSYSDYQSFSNSGNHSEEETFHDTVISPPQHTQGLGEQPHKPHCSNYTSQTSTIQRSRLSTSSNGSGVRERSKHSKHATVPVELKEPQDGLTVSDGKEQVSIAVIEHIANN